MPARALLTLHHDTHSSALLALGDTEDVAVLVDTDIDPVGPVVHCDPLAWADQTIHGAGLLERTDVALRVSEGAADEGRIGGSEGEEVGHGVAVSNFSCC